MCQVNTVPMKSQVGYLDVLGEKFQFYLEVSDTRDLKYCLIFVVVLAMFRVERC